MTIADHHFRLEVANTNATRARGLGGRTTLAADQGMIFTFNDQAVRCFWMKDTLIPLDMIWLDSARRVIHIEHDVKPATYPQTFCANNKPARYVIELKSGAAHAAGITEGRRLTF